MDTEHDEISDSRSRRGTGPLAWLLAVRVLVHWVTASLPLVVVTPLLASSAPLLPG